MKGITPVISIVLLLMITIALIGFAFVWFTKIWNIAAEGAGAGVESTVQQGQKIIRVESVYRNPTTNLFTVSIRNVGTATILGTQLKVYKNEQPVNDCTFSDLLSNAVGTCTATTTTCTSGPPADTIKVSSPSNSDTGKC